MNDALAAIALGRRIDLTRESDFTLGGMEVHPTACEVVVWGERIRLQPRVMQVLVALARTGGEAVSRESLSEVCWGQVTVTDDALNRCIQRLRRLSEEAGGEFTIETIPRLGYRLAVAAQPTGQSNVDVAPQVRRGRIWPRVAASIIGLAVLTAAGIAVWVTRPAHWSIERSETLVSTPLLESQPALSPDGAMVAYAGGQSQTSGQIFLKRISNVESIRLSNDAADGSPAWSPDGARVAYVSWRAGEPCRIMVTALPAGLAREITRCQASEFTGLSWSAAGDALFLSDSASQEGPRRIVRIDLTTGQRLAITQPPGGFDDIEPKVSPDGRWLLFSRISLLPDQIIVRNLKSGQERVLARLPQDDLGAAWAEDSRSVFVVADTVGGSGIWSYPIDGSPRETLIGIGSPLQFQKISTAHGGLLAAEFVTGRYDMARPPGPGETGPVVIDPANSGSWSPAFRKDGTLAEASTRSGQGGIWLMPPGQPARMLLSYKVEVPTGLAWSPDGANLAFVTLGPEMDVRVVSAAGEELVKIRSPGTQTGEPAWSADGRSLLFPVKDHGGWRIWRADLARPDAAHPITDYGWAVVRTEGDAIFGFRIGQTGVWRLGPKPQLVTDKFSGRYPTAFQIYKGEVVFADVTDSRHPRLLAAPIGGGPARPYSDIPGSEDLSFAIDPRTGTPVYVAPISVDRDIELYHLARN